MYLLLALSTEPCLGALLWPKSTSVGNCGHRCPGPGLPAHRTLPALHGPDVSGMSVPTRSPNPYLLHATVDKGPVAWPGGPVHHDAFSELGLLILTHVVRAVQGVQKPCGLGDAKAHGGMAGTLEAWSEFQGCHRPAVCHQAEALPCLGLFSQLSSNFSGSGG